MPSTAATHSSSPGLTRGARIGVLVVAFLGWFFGGMQILLTNLAMRPAAIDLLSRTGGLDLALYNDFNRRAAELVASEAAQLAAWNALATQWYAWLQCAFLFGAAAGGFIFGLLGDRIGRTRALGISILWSAAFTGLACYAQSPAQLLVLRFLACLGLGGTWPNGVALVSEVWSNRARPVISSSIGMAGNIGIFVMSSLAATYAVIPESWQWVMVVNTVPVILGILTLLWVPESSVWQQRALPAAGGGTVPAESVFRPPHLRVTLLGIALATIPLIGGWGSANWMMPWADEIGSRTGDEHLKAHVDNQVDDLASVSLEMANGCVGSLCLGRIGAASHPDIGEIKLHLLGRAGALVIAEARPEVAVYHRGQPLHEFRHCRVADENNFLMMEDLAAAIDGDGTTILDARGAARIAAVVEAALLSAKNGLPVEIKS